MTLSDPETPNTDFISLATAIESLEPPEAQLFVESCRRRVAAFENHPLYAEVAKRVESRMYFDGWLDEPETPGLTEAHQALLFVDKITFEGHPAPFVQQQQNPEARLAATRAHADTMRQMWVEVAGLQGADAGAAEVIADLALTWVGNTPDDWRRLLEAGSLTSP